MEFEEPIESIEDFIVKVKMGKGHPFSLDNRI